MTYFVIVSSSGVVHLTVIFSVPAVSVGLAIFAGGSAFAGVTTVTLATSEGSLSPISFTAVIVT